MIPRAWVPMLVCDAADSLSRFGIERDVVEQSERLVNHVRPLTRFHVCSRERIEGDFAHT